MDEKMDKWMGELMKGWMDRWMSGWMGELMDGQMYGWVNRQKDECMDRWMDGLTDGQVAEWMDRLKREMHQQLTEKFSDWTFRKISFRQISIFNSHTVNLLGFGISLSRWQGV